MATARELLWEIALDQYGYVTVRDAEAVGVRKPTVDMLVSRGQLHRAARGVYRFPQLPVTARDPYMLAVLWTGSPRACLSHDTALAVYDVCDINPDRIHLTVPAARRIRRTGGDMYVVHREDLAAEQLGWWEQIPTVTLPTAVAQCVAGGAPTHLLRQAMERGSTIGALTRDEVRDLTAALEARNASR